jgi:glycosyltransferase involved in cell wall biosynthesis
MPAKNESETIGAVIDSFLEESKKLGIDLSVQVVDDASTDGTKEICMNMGVDVHRNEDQPGLAGVFRTEIKYAIKKGHEAIIHADADGQHFPQDLPVLVGAYRNGCDLVVGNRFHVELPEMDPFRRKGNELLSNMISILVGKNLSDTQCGYRVFSRQVAQHVNIEGCFTYTQEQIIKAYRGGFLVEQVPVHYVERTLSTSRLVKNPFDYLSKVFSDLSRLYI